MTKKHAAKTAKIVILFPYSGYNTLAVNGKGSDKSKRRAKFFSQLINFCKELSHQNPNLLDPTPVVILNRDTENKGGADEFLNSPLKDQVDLVRVWSVDTCQMWLNGWGYVLDNFKTIKRIVLIPGDIDSVKEIRSGLFWKSIKPFILHNESDIVIGDFTTSNKFGAKDLIDQYGTYALLANWFNDLSQKILQLPLNKPRSEFINIDTTILNELLKERKFAYEQTINLLIHSYDFSEKKWKYTISTVKIGEIDDDDSYRQFSGCLDQIERTERMLRLIWREINEPKPPRNDPNYDPKKEYERFLKDYDRLDRFSTSIRETARIVIKNLLGIGA